MSSKDSVDLVKLAKRFSKPKKEKEEKNGECCGKPMDRMEADFRCSTCGKTYAAEAESTETLSKEQICMTGKSGKIYTAGPSDHAKTRRGVFVTEFLEKCAEHDMKIPDSVIACAVDMLILVPGTHRGAELDKIKAYCLYFAFLVEYCPRTLKDAMKIMGTSTLGDADVKIIELLKGINKSEQMTMRPEYVRALMERYLTDVGIAKTDANLLFVLKFLHDCANIMISGKPLCGSATVDTQQIGAVYLLSRIIKVDVTLSLIQDKFNIMPATVKGFVTQVMTHTDYLKGLCKFAGITYSE